MVAQFVVGGVIALVAVTVWHELGHLLVAQAMGIPVVRVAVGFGPALWRRSLTDDTQILFRAVPAGMSVGVPGRYDSSGQLRRPVVHDLAMAAGGPLASFLLSGILIATAVFLPAHSIWFNWFLATGLLSAFVALLNLAPLPGLDGGHILILTAALLGWRLPPHQEIRVHRLGMRVLVVLAILPVLYSLIKWFAV